MENEEKYLTVIFDRPLTGKVFTEKDDALDEASKIAIEFPDSVVYVFKAVARVKSVLGTKVENL